MTVTVTLADGRGTAVFREVLALEAKQLRGFHTVLAAAVRARRVRVDAAVTTGTTARLSIGDLRVQGQTRVLADYIGRTLTFPAP